MNNIYKKYGLRQVINASGKMTILGVSKVEDDVLEESYLGAKNFFVMQELVDNTGKYIANLLGVEAALVIGSASSGIAMSVASVIAKDDLKLILNLHRYKDDLSNEIVIAKGHNVNYGAPVDTMIELGGGKVIEAGFANECTIEQLEAVITKQTVAIVYIKSHHCVQKGIASLEDYVKLAKKYKLALIVDAAAEEDLLKYYNLGADLVIYSGAKAIEAPTSGLIIGKKKAIELVKLQNKGIGRAMKIGKENILGFVKALERYLERQNREEIENSILVMKDKVNKIIVSTKELDNVNAVMTQDSSGREIYRAQLKFACNAKIIADKLKSGDIAIYTRDYQLNDNKIEFDVRSITDEEIEIIIEKLKRILEGE